MVRAKAWVRVRACVRAKAVYTAKALVRAKVRAKAWVGADWVRAKAFVRTKAWVRASISSLLGPPWDKFIYFSVPLTIPGGARILSAVPYAPNSTKRRNAKIRVK